MRTLSGRLELKMNSDQQKSKEKAKRLTISEPEEQGRPRGGGRAQRLAASAASHLVSFSPRPAQSDLGASECT